MTGGTDTYGKVKRVGPTTIVTKFAMLSALPLWPVESYYYAGPGESRTEGIPFISWSTTTAIRGMPLARIDRLSVLMAYIRAVCGTMLVFGSFSIIFLVMSLNNRQLDNFQYGATCFLLILFCAGALGGILTYCLPYQMTRRESDIRRACGELLGICADPALVRQDVAQAVLTSLRDQDTAGNCDPFDARPVRVDRRDSLVQLARVRAMMALRQSGESLERRTDELLAQI